MRFVLFALLFIILVPTINGQTYLDSTINSSTKRILFANPKSFSIGSYGEAHYNAPIESGKFRNGTADLHRIIMFMGYKFNSKLQFFTEIEFEHVKEVYVEQAYLDYSFNSAFNLKAGMVLIPMGYVNEFHEPTLFNGVERPNVDKYVVPSTWRELGFGFHGLVKKANIKYQVYLVNGFNGYDGDANLSGKNGLRSARQKGAEVSLRTPALTGKVSFYGLNGLRLGLAGYYGNSETALYDGLDRNDVEGIKQADSSRVGIAMAGLNAHYNIGKFQFTGQLIYTSISNTEQYNSFTSSNVGSEILGYYTELAYKFDLKKNDYPKLIPFVRYENYNTHQKMAGNRMKNETYNREELTAGLGFQLTPGVIFKTDYQWVKNGTSPKPTGLFNLGIGYWF